MPLQEQRERARQRIRESAEIRLAKDILAAGQVQVWPVGGIIRDFLRGKPASDLDLVVALRQGDEVREYTQRLAQLWGGTLVRLDGKHGYWRIAGLPQGHLDLAALQADTIEADLAVRDFTLNSIAWDLEQEDFIDPLAGVDDCLNGLLRADAEQVLSADPLRNMRAWRFLSGGMQPGPDLAGQVQRQAPLLARVAAERINEELSRIFQGNIAGTWEFACSTGLTRVLWPGLGGNTALAGARLRVWQQRRAAGVVLTATGSAPLRERERRYWASELRYERTRYQLLGLALLVGLEDTTSPEVTATRLALGRREAQLLALMLQEGEAAARLMQSLASPGEWHDFFRRCGAEALGVMGYATLAYGPGRAANLGEMVADFLEQGVVSAPRLAVTTPQLLTRFPQLQGAQVGRLLRQLERTCAERGGLSADETFQEAERLVGR